MKMGLHVRGLPSTLKVEKLGDVMCKAAKRTSIPEEIHPDEFHLHYHKTVDPKNEVTTGDGVYIYPEGTDLDRASKKMDSYRLDKKHTITASVVPICFDCHFPMYLLGGSQLSGFEKASSIDPNVCEMCLHPPPSPITCCCCEEKITELDDPNDMAKVMKYFACRSCWGDRDLQEKWRNNDRNRQIMYTSSSHVEKLHLSDEAIEREKQIYGGVPPKPCEDVTPFRMVYVIERLLDPTAREYWAFGMSSQQYLEHMELSRFNNPLQESPCEDWKSVGVTEELLSNYERDMSEAVKKFNYKSREDKGTLPDEIISGGCKYRFVSRDVGTTCDSAICQAVFHHHYENDGGAWSALVATNIPMFTSRPGNINGTAREAGYGLEICLACVAKTIS